MKILESGKVVGVIDDQTLELVQSHSSDLSELVAEWKAYGLDALQAQDEPLEDGQVCGSVCINIPYKPETFHFFKNQLLIAGYELEMG